MPGNGVISPYYQAFYLLFASFPLNFGARGRFSLSYNYFVFKCNTIKYFVLDTINKDLFLNKTLYLYNIKFSLRKKILTKRKYIS